MSNLPQVLEAKGFLPDALRIAEKMLQPRQTLTVV